MQITHSIRVQILRDHGWGDAESQSEVETPRRNRHVGMAGPRVAARNTRMSGSGASQAARPPPGGHDQDKLTGISLYRRKSGAESPSLSASSGGDAGSLPWAALDHGHGRP